MVAEGRMAGTGKERRVKPSLSTLSFSLAALAVALSLVTTDAGSPAIAATPKPTSAAKTVKPAAKSDVCSATKSKWAHIQCEQFNASAPGDEYFGRMEMSYLGIDNTYRDGAISAGGYTTDVHLISKLDFATEALRRWAAKYPNDPQLPRSYFLAIQVLQKVYTQSEQQTAFEFMQLLAGRYKHTYFGKIMSASLARGFTEHWFALAQVCPTPLPPGVMPENTPSDTPTPSPAPGRPSVDLITPPCVPPSPVPEVTEAPIIEGSPSPVETTAPGATSAPSEKPASGAPPSQQATPVPGPTISPVPGPTLPGPSPVPS